MGVTGLGRLTTSMSLWLSACTITSNCFYVCGSHQSNRKINSPKKVSNGGKNEWLSLLNQSPSTGNTQSFEKAGTVLTAAFDFELPPELIAQYPIEPRDGSRLLVVDRRSKNIEHRQFCELPVILSSQDTLALNNTRVVRARLIGHREMTGGKWEGLFLEEVDDGRWEILCKSRGRLRLGESIVINSGLHLILENQTRDGQWIVHAELQSGDGHFDSAFALLERYGHLPLPPYIRKGKAIAGDDLRYQTAFADRLGSIAAPTAGLHFTDGIFRELAYRGISWVHLTLHIGAGTFMPIKTNIIEDHVMHAEWAELPCSSASELVQCRARGGRIVAVGSTATRTLETAALAGKLIPFMGKTNLFIRPGHVFHGIDALVTNFHLPRSTLLVLVSAFGGMELIRQAYQEAIDHKYRFYSYGDAMLIL